MENYTSRFALGEGKYAYIQREDFKNTAYRKMAEIKDRWHPPDYFFHFRNGGHVAALKYHQSSQFFARIDLARFFEHVTRNKIRKCLKTLGFPFHYSFDFAAESTVCFDWASKRYALPYGFVQSPLLAALALNTSALGRQIEVLSSEATKVSVYVDDIIISGDEPEVIGSAMESLSAAATVAHFPIHPTKTVGPASQIEAFNVNVRHRFMEIAANRMEDFERSIRVAGPSSTSNAILGYVNSVSSIQGEALERKIPHCFS